MMASSRKRVSIRDVADHVGVDPSTVSLALNGSSRVAAGTRARVVRAADDLGYRPNALAQALRRGSMRSVGLLAASLDIPFFVDLLKAQERWLVDHGYSVLFANCRGDADTEQRKIEDMGLHRVEGICVGYPSWRGAPAYRQLTESGIKLAFYVEKQHLRWVENSAANVAVCDLSRGCLALVEHLSDLGHRRISYIGYVTDRELDYRQAMQELGLPICGDWIFDTGSLRAGFDEAVERFAALSPLPTAILTQSDEWAARLINALSTHGIRVPDQVSVVGINNHPLGGLVRVPLTTLALPTAEIGQWMAASVTREAPERAASSDIRFFPTQLVVRESSAPVRKAMPV